MNVELPEATGHGIKGTVLYVLHDKREEGMEAHPTTSERVAWTATRNVPTNGPRTAMNMMIDTWQRRDELKAAAGVKGGTSKSGPVYHFSVNWHAVERGGNPSKADMMKAADEVLKILGFEDLQAVMVCHRDTGKPHVHVVVNRIHPVTGRILSAGPQQGRDLDRWSHDFEVQGGQIFSHDRAAKYAEIDRKKEAHPDPADRRKHIDEQKEKARAAANDRAAMSDQAKAWSDAAAQKTRSKGATLKEKADALKARHKAERSADFAALKNGKDYLWKQRPDIKAMATTHRAETRPLWSTFGKQQAAERKEFYALQRSFLGRLVIAGKFIEREGWRFGMKGYLGLLFTHAAKPKEWRIEQLAKNQAADKEAFAARINAPLDAKIVHARTEHAARLQRFNAAYDITKQKTAERQAGEFAAIKGEWKDYWERREAAEKRRGVTQPAAPVRSRTAATAPKDVDPHATPTAQKSRTGAIWENAAGRPKPPELRAKWGEKAKPVTRDRSRPRGRDDFEPEI